MTESTSNIYMKIAKVLLHPDTKQIAKDTKGYTSDDVYAALRVAMGENNLVCLTNFLRVEDQWAYFEFTLVDADSGQDIKFQWQQLMPKPNGMMTADKCVGAASTYAHKYFLMRTFMLTSSDDPKIDPPSDKPKPQARPENVHWTADRDQLIAFYDQTKKLPLPPESKEQIFEALEVNEIAEYTGTMADAILTVSEHMEELARMESDVIEDHNRDKFHAICTSLFADKDIQKQYDNFPHVENAVKLYQKEIGDPMAAGYQTVKTWMLNRKTDRKSVYTDAHKPESAKNGVTMDSIPD